MNKYIVKALLCSTLAAPVLTSCELDQYPEGSIPTEKSWQTVSDATNYNNGILAAMRSVTSPSYAVFYEVLGDLFNATNFNGSPAYATSHTWTFTATNFDGSGIWSAMYSLISNANNIINNIDNIPVEEGSDDATMINKYKAVAYFARAYAYTQLAVGYCNAYDASTASSTLGLPLVSTVDVNEKPSRSSLADTYAFIKADIAKAKELFPDHSDTDVTAPTYNALRALEAQVSLYSQDYDNAIECATELMNKYSLISDEDEFISMWQNDEGSELIYVPQQTLPDERLSGYGSFISAQDINSEMKYTCSYIPTQGLMDLYDNSDMRKDIYFYQGGIYANSEAEDADAYIFSKYPGNSALNQKQSAYEFYNMSKVYRVAEMYLIAAEAQYYKDGTGCQYLNTLRAARGAKTLSTAAGDELKGSALFTEIKNEWAREMCGEGQRFACLKRWGEGFTRMTPQTLTNGVLYTQSSATTLNIAASNVRWTFEIPQNDLETNENLERNWPTE